MVPNGPRRATGAVQAAIGRREDPLPGVRAFCPDQRAEAGSEARRVYLSRLHPLLRQEQERALQGQTPHQPQEARGQPAGVPPLGAPRQAQADQGRNARPRQGAGPGTPQLLRHHGQRTQLLPLRLSRPAHSAPMAQPQEPASGVQLGPVQPRPAPRSVAARADPHRPESLSKSGGLLNDRARSRMLGKPLVRFCEGPGRNSEHGRDHVAPPGERPARPRI